MPTGSTGWIAAVPLQTTSWSGPPEKRRTEYQILIDLLADPAGNLAALGHGRSRIRVSNPKGWSTLPKLIVYHLDKTITGQLAAIGLKTTDIAFVAVSHTHGDHIGNVRLFPHSTVLMQRAEYAWIRSPDGTNDNVNQLMALARKLMGAPNISGC